MAQRQGEASDHLNVFEKKVFLLMHDCRKLVTDYLADRIDAVHGNLVWGTYHENHHESAKESRTAWTTVDRRYVCTRVGGVFVGRRPPRLAPAPCM